MKREKQGILVLGVMVLAMFLLFPGAVMKAKAGESVNANLTIYFVEDVRGDTIGRTNKNITIIKNVSEDGGTITYSGTIDLSDVTYINDDIPNDRRSIFGWYDSGWTSFSGPYVFENVSLTNSGADGVVEMELYALCSKTAEITFISNHSRYARTDDIVVLKYYPQSSSDENSKIIIPREDSELEFTIDGFTFRGWSAESGIDTTNVSESVNIDYNDTYRNKEIYAHWQDQRHSPDVPITGAGEYYLEPGTAYSLGSGNWTVNGGSTKYTGGITFYVNSAGYYTFSN